MLQKLRDMAAEINLLQRTLELEYTREFGRVSLALYNQRQHPSVVAYLGLQDAISLSNVLDLSTRKDLVAVASSLERLPEVEEYLRLLDLHEELDHLG